MANKNDAIQGSFNLELKLVDDRVYLTFWDMLNGNDVACEIKQGKLHKFVYSAKEIEDDEVEDENQIPIDDHLKQEEITLAEFLELVKKSIASASE